MNEPRDLVASRERQVKFAQGRVAAVEKYYGLFCETLGSVIRKSARLRNKSDMFAHQLKEFAETEKLSSLTRSSLLSFAENLSTVQDYRNTQVHRLEAKVLTPLTKYGELCKNMKNSIKGNKSAWTKEKKQSEKLRKLQQKAPSTTPEIAKAQAELQKMRQQAGQFEEQLLTEVDKFEKSKLTDMKSVLSEFVQIEMMFHARALEYLSRCYEAAQHIETEIDLDHFRASLLEAGGLAHAPQAMPSYSERLAPGMEKPIYHQPPQPTLQRYDVAYDSEDDDDDDDDDDEDEYES